MREILREGGWPIYPVILFGAIALVSAVRYARDPSRDRLAWLVGFVCATVLMGALGTGLGLQISAIGAARNPMFRSRMILCGFYESMHNLDLGLAFAVVSTLIATLGRARKGAGGAVAVDG